MKIALFISLLLAGTLFASSSETIKGLDAFKKKHYEEAYQHFLVAAKHGDANAQLRLGAMFDRGKGVVADHEMAVYWYTRAARGGDVNAQYNLGSMFEKGDGVEKSETAAYKWFTKAARQGSLNAKRHLEMLCDDYADLCE